MGLRIDFDCRRVFEGHSRMVDAGPFWPQNPRARLPNNQLIRGGCSPLQSVGDGSQRDACKQWANGLALWLSPFAGVLQHVTEAGEISFSTSPSWNRGLVHVQAQQSLRPDLPPALSWCAAERPGRLAAHQSEDLGFVDQRSAVGNGVVMQEPGGDQASVRTSAKSHNPSAS